MPTIEIETLGPSTAQIGHASFFGYFVTLLELAPDLIVITGKPKLINGRLIAADIHIHGTKMDYSNIYLDMHVKYFMEQVSFSSSSRSSISSMNALTTDVAAGHRKRTYREFIAEEKHVCFNMHFTVHFILNSGFTHVERFNKLLKSVKLSVPRVSTIP